MSDPIAIYERTALQVGGIIAAIAPGQIDAPTPRAEGDVPSVINHIIGGAEFTAGFLSGVMGNGEIASPRSSYTAERDVTKLAQAYAAESDKLLAATRRPGALERGVPMSSGEMPAGQFVIATATDHLIHVWDLANATGQDVSQDADLMQTAYGMLTSPERAAFTEGARQAGFVSPEIPAPRCPACKIG